MIPKINMNANSSGSWLADIVILIYGIVLFFIGKQESSISGYSNEGVALLFIVVISLVPWYSGYLLHHFDQYKKWLRRIIQWIFGAVILSLIIFLVLTLMPVFDEQGDPTPFQVFIAAFGMFFMVLGPMMMIGGYADAQFLDDKHSDGPIKWPMVTFTMLILVLAILFMILIIGLFDPTWKGNAGFGVVMLGFFGGPLAAILVVIPFGLAGSYLEKVDKHRILPKILAYLIPLLVFNSLIWWNDIVLKEMSPLWEGQKPSVPTIVWSMTLAGIIPFRLLLSIKPPFLWIRMISGVIALAVYVLGVISYYQ